MAPKIYGFHWTFNYTYAVDTYTTHVYTTEVSAGISYLEHYIYILSTFIQCPGQKSITGYDI